MTTGSVDASMELEERAQMLMIQRILRAKK
jgi:hypothetical protein